ncbi:caspase family protein [Aquibium oceanicum]|nr:caspase family protein [Aquibium oceanicum]
MGAAGLVRTSFAAPEARTYYAVLVAATAYPNLPPKSALIGPNHDAQLVREYLLGNSPVKFDAANIILLADNLDGAIGSPTLDGILSGLAQIAAWAKRGDFVYIHYSGHGSQQPALSAGDETDGLDEILLPSDTGMWTDRTKGVPNALTDNMVGQALDAIRNKGAFVWIVLDCCNSGTATRAAPVGEDLIAERKLDPSDLGIPASEIRLATAAEESREVGEGQIERQAAFAFAEDPTSAQGITRGDLVAFFAAQSIETTPEMPLPKGQPDATKFGLFTFTIFQKLAENPNVTYRQLGHAVLQQYTADGRIRPTPLFEGALDARVFGSEIVDTPMQWPLESKGTRGSIAAGLMHRLVPGSKLAILPGPLSEMSEALGYVEVVAAKNLTSMIKPVAYEDRPLVALSDIPAGAYVRVARLEIDFSMVVARPGAVAGLEKQTADANAMLDVLAADPGRRFNIRLVDPGEEADLRLAVLPENAILRASPDGSDAPALWFLPPSGDVSLKDGSKPPFVAAVDPERLRVGAGEVLAKIFRATSLSRLAAGSDYRPEQVMVEFKLKRPSENLMKPLQQATVPRVLPGDEVHILAKNLSSKLIDINILYVGSDYSITHIDAQRLVPNATIEEGLLAFTDASFGFERMIAVLTEAPPQSAIEDLSFLAQGGVPPATRAASGQPAFSDMLRDIGLAPATRSAMKLGDKNASMGAVLIFPVETVPAS